MSDLVKDIVGSYLKEDLQQILRRTTELKEDRLSENDLQSRISSIAKMNKLADPNKIYAGKTLNVDGSKYTIKRGDTLTKIARSFPGTSKAPPAPAPKPSNQYDRTIPGAVERLPAGPNTRFQRSAPVPKPTAAEPKNDIKQQYGTPEDLAKDINRAKSMPKVAPQIRSATPQASPAPNTRSADQIPGMGPRIQNYYDRKLSADKVAPEAPAPMATPKASETPKDDTSTVSSALKNKLSPSQLGSNPENLVNKDVLKGREPKSMNESFVSVGTNKYRIV